MRKVELQSKYDSLATLSLQNSSSIITNAESIGKNASVLLDHGTYIEQDGRKSPFIEQALSQIGQDLYKLIAELSKMFQPLPQYSQ